MSIPGVQNDKIYQLCCSVAKSCLCNPMDCSKPGFLCFTVSWSLLKLMSIESVMPSNHIILCHSLLLLPSIFPSLRVFSNKLDLRITWPEYWSFSFSISPYSEYSGLISFRIDWFDLLTVQGTLKSLLRHHGLKASVLWWSAFLCLYINPNFPIYPSLLSPIGNHKFIFYVCDSTSVL